MQAYVNIGPYSAYNLTINDLKENRIYDAIGFPDVRIIVLDNDVKLYVNSKYSQILSLNETAWKDQKFRETSEKLTISIG